MKTLFALLFVVLVVPLQAQRRDRNPDQRPRNLTVVVRDNYGGLFPDAEVFASIKGGEGGIRFERIADRYRVVESDTLCVFVGSEYYEVPVAGLDSLLLTVTVPERTGLDSINYIDAVSVTAQGQRRINTGQGTIDADRSAGSAYSVPLRKGYRDLKAAIDGRVGGVEFRGMELLIRGYPAVVVVDGFPVESFSDANDRVMIDDVESISVHKDAGMAAFYNGRGGGKIGGVVVITTNRGYSQRRRR